MTDTELRAIAAHTMLINALLRDRDRINLTEDVSRALSLSIELETERVGEMLSIYTERENMEVLDNGD